MALSTYPKNRYVSGTYKRVCDRCGFDYLRSELRKEWQGLIVCDTCFEEKHPQLEPRRIREIPLRVD